QLHRAPGRSPYGGGVHAPEPYPSGLVDIVYTGRSVDNGRGPRTQVAVLRRLRCGPARGAGWAGSRSRRRPRRSPDGGRFENRPTCPGRGGDARSTVDASAAIGNAAMAHKTLVGPTSELGPGRVVGAGGWAVGNAGGTYFAVSRRCRHLGADLAGGSIDDEGCLE